jgi:predicted NBD/HSP70 family sugar kinase
MAQSRQSAPQLSSNGNRVGSGLQLESLRRRNAASVAEVILRKQHVSRAEIATLVGLSQGAVTKITAELRRAGLIVEAQSSLVERDPGRPRVPVTVDRSTFRFAGVHIGLRRSTVGLVDLSGQLVIERVAEHRSLEPTAVLREARGLLQRAHKSAGGVILGAGVCAGGWVDPERGLLREHPALGWADVSLGEAVGQLEVPTVVDSSVRALALANSRFGAGRDSRNMLYLFVGNIVGAAHLIDGRTAPGRESAAGTIDHLPVGPSTGVQCSCGRQNCLWSLASDVAVVERARSAGLIGEQGQLEDVINRANGSGAESRRATSILRDRARYAGVAVGLLLDLLAPDIVVLDGGILQAPQFLDTVRDAARKCTARHADAAELIVPTGLGEGGLVRGAATLALDAFYRDPLAATTPSVAR